MGAQGGSINHSLCEPSGVGDEWRKGSGSLGSYGHENFKSKRDLSKDFCVFQWSI